MRSTLCLSFVPSYPTRSAACRGFVLSRVSPLLSESGFVAAVFFSHPDESNIVEKIIAMNVERSVFFIGVMRWRLATVGYRGKHAEVVPQWGRWLPRLVRSPMNLHPECIDCNARESEAAKQAGPQKVPRQKRRRRDQSRSNERVADSASIP